MRGSRLGAVASILGVVCLVVLAGVADAGETDLSGTWTMTMEGDSPTGAQEVGLTFSQEGSSLIATMTSDKGETECEGHLEGNSLRFYYVRSTAGENFVAMYSGHVGGDVMGGEVTMGEHGKTSWKATRKK